MFKKHSYAVKVTSTGSGIHKYKEAYLKEKEAERLRLELMLRQRYKSSDRMMCRMFHPSNGRNNFDTVYPTVPLELMPPRETLIKILSRDNELRLSSDIQEEYWVSDFPSKITLKVQTQAVNEYKYEDPWIIPSALAYYKDDPEIMGIPHYVKYNRSQPGKIKVGDQVPDLPLTHLKGCGTSMHQELAPHSSLPVVLVAGSYT